MNHNSTKLKKLSRMIKRLSKLLGKEEKLIFASQALNDPAEDPDLYSQKIAALNKKHREDPNLFVVVFENRVIYFRIEIKQDISLVCIKRQGKKIFSYKDLGIGIPPVGIWSAFIFLRMRRLYTNMQERHQSQSSQLQTI
jgi:hypothetical protein